MADDQALQGPPSHLAPGSRGRAQIIAPYQPHGFTGYEPNRSASISTPRRTEKLLDHQESTQILGLTCPHQDLGFKLQPKSGGCLLKLFTSIWEMRRPLGRGLFMSSKRLSMLPIKRNFRGLSWRRLRDPFEKNSPCKQKKTPQPLCATGAILLHLTFEKCGISSSSRSGKYKISPPARTSC